jgi:hypothetical protein
MASVGNTMTRAAIAGLVLAMLLALPSRHPAQAQDAAVESSTRFSDTLRLTTPKGAALPLHVEFRDWNVTRNANGTELPLQGLYLAHLASGDVVTLIAGKSETRHAGDFWTVDKGARMLVRIAAPQESAIIQTLVVSPGR